MDRVTFTVGERKTASKNLDRVTRQMAIAGAGIAAKTFIEFNQDPIKPLGITSNPAFDEIRKRQQAFEDLMAKMPADRRLLRPKEDPLQKLDEEEKRQAEKDEIKRQIKVAEASFIAAGVAQDFPQFFDWNVSRLDCTVTSSDKTHALRIHKRTNDHGKTYGNTDIVVLDNTGNAVRRLVHDHDFKNTTVYGTSPDATTIWPLSGDAKDQNLKELAELLPTFFTNAFEEKRVVSHIKDGEPHYEDKTVRDQDNFRRDDPPPPSTHSARVYPPDNPPPATAAVPLKSHRNF